MIIVKHKWSDRTAEVLATGELLRVRWTDDKREISLPASDFYDVPACANCGQSRSADPKCGLCCGPTATTTRWEPLGKTPTK